MDKEQRKKDLLATFNDRHATKAFDPTKIIPAEDFEFILETGRLSPSSTGLEPWHFVVLQNEDLIAQIAEHSFGAKHLGQASHVVLYYVRKDLSPYSDYFHYITREVKGIEDEVMIKRIQNLYVDFQGNDIKITGDERAMVDWAGKQAYIALGNMMTAAAHIGIDSCPIEGFNYDEVRDILEDAGVLDTDVFEISVICAFGYRAEPPKRAKIRQPLADIVSWIK